MVAPVCVCTERNTCASVALVELMLSCPSRYVTWGGAGGCCSRVGGVGGGCGTCATGAGFLGVRLDFCAEVVVALADDCAALCTMGNNRPAASNKQIPRLRQGRNINVKDERHEPLLRSAYSNPWRAGVLLERGEIGWDSSQKCTRSQWSCFGTSGRFSCWWRWRSWAERWRRSATAVRKSTPPLPKLCELQRTSTLTCRRKATWPD